MAQVVRTGPAAIMGWEKLTVSTTAVSLTEASYHTGAGTSKHVANGALITIEDAGIRVRFDAGTPVDLSDTGHSFAAGTSITLESITQIKNFRAVRVGGTDAVINVTYFEGA